MNNPLLDPREEHFRVPGPHAGLHLFLRRLSPRQPTTQSPAVVLYVHGATFPSALSIAHRFDGRSWRDELNDAGFDVWALDFHGFGGSDPHPEMDDAPEAHPPLGDASDAAGQLAAAVRFILDRHAASRLSLIAHSWGSMPACRFAGESPSLVDRLVLFAPIARRAPRLAEPAPMLPAWRLVSVEDQHRRFVEDVPSGLAPLLGQAHFDDWAGRYLDSDSGSRWRAPPAVKVPAGPSADIVRAWQGRLAYEPAWVQAPVALIRGEWDRLLPDADARWLFDAFTASPNKRDIKIGGATHLMHLEAGRYGLYRESIGFLQGGDTAPAAAQPPR